MSFGVLMLMLFLVLVLIFVLVVRLNGLEIGKTSSRSPRLVVVVKAKD